jgi:hypothetical protein
MLEKLSYGRQERLQGRECMSGNSDERESKESTIVSDSV